MGAIEIVRTIILWTYFESTEPTIFVDKQIVENYLKKREREFKYITKVVFLSKSKLGFERVQIQEYQNFIFRYLNLRCLLDIQIEKPSRYLNI